MSRPSQRDTPAPRAVHQIQAEINALAQTVRALVAQRQALMLEPDAVIVPIAMRVAAINARIDRLYEEKRCAYAKEQTRRPGAAIATARAPKNAQRLSETVFGDEDDSEQHAEPMGAALWR